MTTPSLQVTSWVRDPKVTLPDKGSTNMHVITFLETWCSSCMAVLPDLWRMQEQMKGQGVVFTGIFDESNEVVRAFCDNGEVKPRLNYSVGVDDEHKTYDSFMKAFGKTRVPCSFVIDRAGTIVWVGPPTAGLEDTLTALNEGKFDLEGAKKVAAAEALQDDYFKLVVDEPGFKLVSQNTNSSPAKELGYQILRDAGSNPWVLNNFAWRILTEPPVQSRDLNLAMQVASSAVKADKHRTASFSDTYAKALFQLGKTSEAIDAQKHAIELAIDPNHRLRLERTLQTYLEAVKSSTGK